MTRKILIGVFIALVIFLLLAAMFYPEQLIIAVISLVVGYAGGMLSSNMLFESYFNKGADMVHEWQKKQVINPVAALREARLDEQQKLKSAVAQPQQQVEIPRIGQITGLH